MDIATVIMEDEIGSVSGEEELFPLYSAEAGPACRSQNLSCSGSRAFCYLCSYSGETGLCTDVRQHIRTLASDGYEIPQIVNAVHTIYNRDLREHCTHTLSNGHVVQAPEWSKEAITRHITYGGEFADTVFQRCVIQNIFTHLIAHQTKRIISGDGRVNNDARQALLHTIGEMGKWRRNLQGIGTPGKGAGKKKGPP